jgi:succinoglycan biosynthesis protein ExoA
MTVSSLSFQQVSTVATTPLPFVTVLMPVRNEEAFLRLSLDSLLANDYPLEMLEIIVIDGMSSDRSREIIQEYSQRYPCIKYLQNPERIVSTGLNLGIQAAEGYIIVRADAHALYESDYIRQCVSLLQSSGAANVGGAQRAIGTSLIGSAIAVATTSKFGTGDAKFRYSDQEAWVDTVYLGAWHREKLIGLGGFTENLTVNQDYELNHRIRREGGRILLSPKIRCQYYVRGSLFKLAKQYFRYGFWKVNTLVLHPYSLKWRQAVAPLLVASLLVAFLLAGISQSVFWLGPALVYLSATIIASGRALRSAPWRVVLALPFVYMVLHLSWGVGFWCGLFRFGVPGLKRSRPASRVQKFTSPVSYGR